MKQKPKYDFSQPNKLARKALWLVLGKTLYAIFRGFWALVALIAVRGFPTDKNSYWLYLLVVILFLFTFFRLFINYFYYSYQIIDDELIIQEGWLSKSKTVLKMDKIHEVNLSQKLIHKLIGLYMVKVDTAGSSKTEIAINGVDYHKALALKEVLTNAKIATDEHSETAQTDETVFLQSEKTADEEKITISLPSLIKIGLTRNYLQTLGLMIAFSFQIIDQAKDFLFPDEDEVSVYSDIFNAVPYEQYIGLIGVLIIFGLIIFVVLFNLGRTLLTYFHYQINIKNKQLTVSYGLTEANITAVPSQKVQLFQLQQNYFQKLMNLFEVKIQQIESSEKKKKKGLVVPGANRAEANKIFRVIYEQDATIPTDFQKPHRRVLWLKFFWFCIPALVALAFFYFSETMHYAWIILPLFAFVYFLIYCGYRNEKLYIQDDFIILKKGIWDVTTTYLQISKIQHIAVKQSYFQQKRHLGSLNLHTAAGTVIMYYYDFDQLQKLANQLLYKMEKNRCRWM